jgi:hypothetical protein
MKRFALYVAFWLPFVFAVFLSCAMLWDPKAARPAFYSFLPMAFFFVGSAFLALRREVARLETRLKELEAVNGRRPSGSGAS